MYNGNVYFKDDFKVWANRILKESEKIMLRISTAVSSAPLGGGSGNPLQYSCLGNSGDRGA